MPKNSCQNVNKPGVGDDMSVITFEWFLGLVRSEKLAILLSSTMLEKPEWFGKVEFSSTFFKIGLKAKYNLLMKYTERSHLNNYIGYRCDVNKCFECSKEVYYFLLFSESSKFWKNNL